MFPMAPECDPQFAGEVPAFAAEIQRAYEVPRPTTKSKMSPGRLSHAGELQELFSADHHSPALCRLTD
jgi:hypothetical protein